LNCIVGAAIGFGIAEAFRLLISTPIPIPIGMAARVLAIPGQDTIADPSIYDFRICEAFAAFPAGAGDFPADQSSVPDSSSGIWNLESVI